MGLDLVLRRAAQADRLLVAHTTLPVALVCDGEQPVNLLRLQLQYLLPVQHHRFLLVHEQEIHDQQEEMFFRI